MLEPRVSRDKGIVLAAGEAGCPSERTFAFGGEVTLGENPTIGR